MRTGTFVETITTKFCIEECCNCGIAFAMTEEFKKDRLADKRSWYCPNGHCQHYLGKTDAQLRKEAEEKAAAAEENARRAMESLEWEKQYSKRLYREKENTENRLRSTKGVVTKLKKRAANGVCPCCSRTFSQLARHMANIHPEFVVAQNQPAPTAADEEGN